jgi:hypothetical protein
VKRRLRRTYRHHLLPHTHAGSSLADFSTLKLEAIRSSETSVHKFYTAPHPRRRHSSRHRCENLKSYKYEGCSNETYSGIFLGEEVQALKIVIMGGEAVITLRYLPMGLVRKNFRDRCLTDYAIATRPNTQTGFI